MPESSGTSEFLPSFRRGLEAVEFEHEGKPMILLRDQEGFLKQSIGITPAAFFIAMMLNGQTRIEDIQTMLTQSTGQLVSAAEIKNVITQFEKMELLETPAIQEKRKKTVEEFTNSPSRPAYFAGSGYPKDNLDLAIYLGKFFKDPKGPNKELVSSPTKNQSLLGMISPHIDFNRGGAYYAWAYQALSETQMPDIIVGVGVAHVSPNSPWVMTKKAYDTPYGPMALNENLFNDFKSALWYDPTADEIVHRTEHSLEFQALWLKYLWREKTPAWLPILCSSFDRFCPDRAPSTVDTIESALVAMGNKLKARQDAGQKILILAGVDMAHVGPRFGDELELTPELRAKIEKEDRASIEPLLKLDADAFYLSVVKDEHWRKWCGLSALYTSMRLIKMLSGGKDVESKLLSYAQADDPAGGVVSFASATFI